MIGIGQLQEANRSGDAKGNLKEGQEADGQDREARIPPPTPMATSTRAFCRDDWVRANPSPVRIRPRITRVLAAATETGSGQIRTLVYLGDAIGATTLPISATTMVLISLPAMMAMIRERDDPKKRAILTSKTIVRSRAAMLMGIR